MPAHGGVLRGSNLPALLKSITIAPAGLALNHAEASTIGLRNGDVCSVSFKTEGDPDGHGREIPNRVKATVVATSLGASFTQVKNAYFYTHEPVVGKIVTQNDKTWNFAEDTTPATPDAGRRLGVGFKYELTNKISTLGYTMKTNLTLPEYNKMIDLRTTGLAGETGGSTLGITGTTYARSTYNPGGFHQVQITNSSGAALAGILKEANFTLESEGNEDQLERPQHRKLKYMLSGTVLANSDTDIDAFQQDATEDITSIVATTLNGNTVTINTPSVNFEVIEGDKDREIKFSVTGTIPYNKSEASPDTITWAATTIAISHPALT